MAASSDHHLNHPRKRKLSCPTQITQFPKRPHPRHRRVQRLRPPDRRGAGEGRSHRLRLDARRRRPQRRRMPPKWPRPRHGHGVDLRAVELDVQSEPSANAAAERIIAKTGRIDVIIHNAGHMMFGPAEFTPEQFAQQYDVNVLGTQRVNRAVLPHMRKQKQGLLVWVSSSSSAGGTPPYLSPYFAAKAAMDALAVQYARELSAVGASKPRSWCPAPSPKAPTTLPIPAVRPTRLASRNMKQVLTKVSARKSKRRSRPSCLKTPTLQA